LLEDDYWLLLKLGYFFYYLFGLFRDIIVCYFFGKVQITVVIMLKFFRGTNDIYLVLFLPNFWVIFAALCLQKVLNAGSDRGPKKLEMPP
jgi:hypothetical protein